MLSVRVFLCSHSVSSLLEFSSAPNKIWNDRSSEICDNKKQQQLLEMFLLLFNYLLHLFLFVEALTSPQLNHRWWNVWLAI